MKNIYGITYNELENYFININDKNIEQLNYMNFYIRKINDLTQMHNIPNKIKEKLLEDFDFSFIKLVLKQEDVNVKKYLWTKRS